MLYISAEQRAAVASAFERLYTIISKLRSPDGCPWDKEQTPISLRSTLIEESFEAVDALAEKKPVHIAEELGDVLLNVIMIAYMFEQQDVFSVSEVLSDISEKLIRRHPHVFPESTGKACLSTADTADKVLSQWEAIKQKIEGRQGESVLDSIPEGFPPLLKAYKMQKKASKKGFDWDTLDAVFTKVAEELTEVQDAAYAVCENRKIQPFTVHSTDKIDKAQLHLEEEIGDLLFAIVNWSRHMSVDPSIALGRANAKFERRFRYVEQRMKESNLEMSPSQLEVMNSFWKEAKNCEK